MSTPTKALTDKQVKALKPKAYRTTDRDPFAQKPKAYRVTDRDGLFLMVLPTGGKIWRTKWAACIGSSSIRRSRSRASARSPAIYGSRACSGRSAPAKGGRRHETP
jgi:hypothetical protein